MKTYYLFQPDVNKYKDFQWSKSLDSCLNGFRGGKKADRTWTPPTFSWWRDRRELGDFPKNPFGAYCPVFSPRAWDALRPLIGESAQPIPLTVDDGGSYVLANVFDVVDCLDREQSEITYFTGTTAINSIQRYVFRESALDNKHIFRIPEKLSEVYVSQEFVDTVRRTGLLGLEFRPLPGTGGEARAKPAEAAVSRRASRKEKPKPVRPKGTTVEIKTARGVFKVRGSLPPVSEARLAAVQNSLKIELPEEYLAFLRTCNGGSPQPDGFRRPRAKEPLVYVHRFLEVSNDEDASLVENFKLYKRKHRWLPENLVPIATDPGGSLICLSVAGKDRGGVYFWDHEQASERELNDPSDYEDVTLIAKSFDKFLAGFPER